MPLLQGQGSNHSVLSSQQQSQSRPILEAITREKKAVGNHHPQIIFILDYFFIDLYKIEHSTKVCMYK